MTDRAPYLTHATGAPVSDNLNIQTAGRRGPALLQDIWPARALQPQGDSRALHARQGSGAFGTFTFAHDISRYTKARIFSERASGPRCSPDSRPSPASAARPMPSARYPGLRAEVLHRGRQLDMVGNDTPVFFVRDPPPWHLFVVGRLFNRKPTRKCSFENADNGSFSLCLNILINALGADVWCSRPSQSD